jgi:tetratricopeptide (TPR) repeat protein
VDHLGNVLERQGKYDEAEAMLRRALEAREKVRGGMLVSKHLLSCCQRPAMHSFRLFKFPLFVKHLSKQGKYEEAEAIHRRVQTVDSSTIMQQRILPRKVFSTIHSLYPSMYRFRFFIFPLLGEH